MINNKMLKEPLFLEFNSSGVLNRAEQNAILLSACNRSDASTLDSYSLLSEENKADVLLNNVNDCKQHISNQDTNTNNQETDNTDDMMYHVPCFCSQADALYLPNCFNICFSVSCFNN